MNVAGLLKRFTRLISRLCSGFHTGRDGAVLVIVLWITMLITVLAASMTSTMRLSSLSALYYKKSGVELANRFSALAQAKMELMLVRMPAPVGVDQTLETMRKEYGYRLKEAYLFNGRDLTLHYPLPDNTRVRIYDHAGKISLTRLTVPLMKQLLLKLLPEKSDKRLDELLDSWQDWVDADNLKRVGGAEKEYYQTLDPPYSPRNAPLETVDELRLIKGFDQVFADIDLREVFTMYENRVQVNFNLATPATLALIPGLDQDDVEAILRLRTRKEIRSSADLAGDIPAGHLRLARPWMDFVTSNFYTIGIYHPDTGRPEALEGKSGKSGESEKSEKPETGDRPSPPWGYAEIVQVRGYSEKPKTLRVDPMVPLPDNPPWTRGPRQKASGKIPDTKL